MTFRDLQIDWLKCFVPVVDAGSLSGAAPEVHRSQSALPIAVYEDASLAKHSALHSLALQGRRFKVVYNSSSLAGQIAAVESGLAVAVLTQCSAPSHLKILGAEQGLGPLEPMEVSVFRSRASRGSKAVDSLHDLLIRTLRLSGQA